MNKENVIARSVVDAAYRVHVAFGPGLLESVYERVLTYELNKVGHKALSQVPVPIVYDGQTIDDAFRMDILVDDSVIIELKSVEQIQPVHKKQLFTYLELSGKRLGLLIHFNVPLIKNGISRVANGLPDE